jgi:hypothetical protein
VPPRRETGHNPEIERPNTLNKVLLQVLGEEQRSFEQDGGDYGIKAQSAF